jgi:hypothetical protein
MTNDGAQPAKFAYGLDELTKLFPIGRSTFYEESGSGG